MFNQIDESKEESKAILPKQLDNVQIKKEPMVFRTISNPKTNSNDD